MSDPATPPPADEQRRCIRRLIRNNPLKLGESAYLISLSWFTPWRESVGFRDDDLPTEASVPPIDNTTLLTSSQVLRPEALEGTDFAILSAPVWAQLHAWFGGGPPIPVPVTAGSDGLPVAIIRVFPIVLHIESNLSHPIIVSTNNFETLASILCANRITPSAVRVFEYIDNKRGKQLSKCRTIGDHALGPDFPLLVERKSGGFLAWFFSLLCSWPKPRVARPLPPRLNGVVGLRNLGNTCFFNSGTQCLLHTRLLARHMLGERWRRELNVRNPLGTRGELAAAFADLCFDVWVGDYASVSPGALKRVIGRFAPQFSGWSQQDSHELLVFMLDGLHEDLNRVVNRPSFANGVFGDGTDDAACADAAWRRHTSRNESVVVDLFHGQYRSRLDCPKCGNVTVVFDPFMSLALPITRQAVAQVSLQFVPFQFAAPIRQLSLSVPGPKIAAPQLRKALNDELGRQVDVLFASRSTFSSTIYWDSRADLRLAFELPDLDVFYVPCIIKLCVRAGFLDASHVFLLGLRSTDVDKSEILDALEKKLEVIWERSEESALPAELQKHFAVVADPPPAITFATGRRLTCFVGKVFNPNVQSVVHECALEAPKDSSRILTNVIIVVLNPRVRVNMATLLCNLQVARAPRPAAAQDPVTLADCFRFSAEPEVLDEQNQWFCPRCKTFVCAKKQVHIWKVPEVLIIQLKRFVAGRYQAEKVGKFVQFPDQINMKEFVVGPQAEHNQHYRLFAVSNHMGFLGGGHYTAHAIVQDPRAEPDPHPGWYEFNDQSVSRSSAKASHTPAAYLLFYERVPGDFWESEDSEKEGEEKTQGGDT
jgi:ubiquitin carboxyl-terminal hydrolase 4/11/15